MNELITRITNFLNLTKLASLTAPGVIISAAVAIILWPLTPVDRIVFPNSTIDLNDCQSHSVSLQEMAAQAPGISRGAKMTPYDKQRIAHRVLELLEIAEIGTSDCLADAKRRLGDEAIQTESEKALRKTLEIQRDTLQRIFLSYKKSNSSLANKYERDVSEIEDRIKLQDVNVMAVQDRERSLQKSVNVLTEHLRIISNKLAQSGRAEARGSATEIWAALTDHVLAFSVFAVLVGFVFQPISTLVGNTLFETIGANFMNNQRSNRIRVQKVQQ